LKKLLLVAIALVAAGSIAFAISAFTGSSGPCTPAPAQVEQDASGGPGTLAMDNCIAYVGILYCVPSQAGKCCVAFRVKHWDKSENCCDHDVEYLWFTVGGGSPGAMTANGSGYDEGCYYHNYDSCRYELDNGFTVFYEVHDSADPQHCKNSGSFYIHCE